jgi:negative regulator of flagellin synthesis FlgM
MGIDVGNLTQSRATNISNENRHSTVGRTANTAQQAATGKTASTETVSMTDAAINLKKMSKRMEKLPVVDAKRVEQLRKAIENGDFEIDDIHIADKLIGLDKLLRKETN